MPLLCVEYFHSLFPHIQHYIDYDSFPNSYKYTMERSEVRVYYELITALTDTPMF